MFVRFTNAFQKLEEVKIFRKNFNNYLTRYRINFTLYGIKKNLSPAVETHHPYKD